MDEIIVSRAGRFGRLARSPATLGGLALAVGFAGFLAFGPGRATPTVELDTLTVSSVERGDFVEDIPAYGRLTAVRTMALSAPESGRVERVALQPGAKVSAGDEIILLFSRDADEAVTSAEVALASAQADAAAARARHARELRLLQSELDKAALEARSLELEKDAEQQLLEQQAISRIAARRTALRYDLLVEGQRQVERELDQLRQSIAIEQEAVALKLERLQSAYRSALRRQDALTLRAEFDGILAAVDATPGQVVASGTAFGEVIDPRELRARLQVSERQARLLKVGQRVVVDTPSGRLNAVIRRIDPTVVKGQVAADADFTDPLPAELRPDLAISARIVLDNASNALSVLKPSGLNGPGEHPVFVVQGDHAYRRPVVFGAVSADRAVVVRGLREGERIVVSDVGRWRDQDKIEVR